MVAFGTALIPAAARAADYYLAPEGVDANAGTSPQEAWKTFSRALPVLLPGDTLVLTNGTYSAFAGGSGELAVDCGSGMSNGTATLPITVRAESERGALLQGDGNNDVIEVLNCSFWRFEGLHVRSADRAVTTNMDVIYIDGSTDLVLRRLLVARNNREDNSALVSIWFSARVLVEESEFYEFHHLAIELSRSNDCVVRRSYFNSRGFPDLPSGYASPIPTRGDNAIYVWSQGSGNIFENNISEGQSRPYAVTGLGTTAGNAFLGNISLDDFTGAFIEGGTTGTPPTVLPTGNRFENHVVVGSTRFGARFRTSRDSRCDNCTLMGTAGTGLVADESFPGNGQLTAYADNTLVTGFPDRGFEFVSQFDWRVRFPNAFGNGTQYVPFPGNFENTREVDPQLGPCRIFIPAASPMKGAGLNGEDIGANVLFRYENGLLTGTPLWDLDGRFPCGAEVAGVNDLPGSSCFDVHARLNVNANGCSLPLESTPTLRVSDVTVAEDGGAASVMVTLSPPSAWDVTFDWATADGTALSGIDYTASSGTGTMLAAGSTSTVLVIPLLQDDLDEADETFGVVLSNATHATVEGTPGTVTLTDDDPQPWAGSDAGFDDPQRTLSLAVGCDCRSSGGSSAMLLPLLLLGSVRHRLGKRRRAAPQCPVFRKST